MSSRNQAPSHQRLLKPHRIAFEILASHSYSAICKTVSRQILCREIKSSNHSWHAFLETPEDFPGPKAIFESQSLSIGDEVFSPKTSAKFLVDLRFFLLVFKTNEN